MNVVMIVLTHGRTRRALLLLLIQLGLSVFTAPTELSAQTRLMRPADLFAFERIGIIAWTPDRSRAAVEIHRPSDWLDRGVPSADIAVLDVQTGRLRTVSPSRSSRSDIVGFFRPAWSPDNRRLVFLSVDRDARVRAWLWTAGAGAPRLLTNLELHAGLADPPVAVWRDADHVVFMTRDPARPWTARCIWRSIAGVTSPISGHVCVKAGAPSSPYSIHAAE